MKEQIKREEKLSPLDTTKLERIPPYNIEAEESLLGSMLISRDAIVSVMDIINSEDFYRKTNQEIFNAIMELYIKVDENGVITDAKFKTFGCGAAIATSSVLTELVKGRTVEEADKISNTEIVEALGGLPKVKIHCSLLGVEALKNAIEDYRKKSGKNA